MTSCSRDLVDTHQALVDHFWLCRMWIRASGTGWSISGTGRRSRCLAARGSARWRCGTGYPARRCTRGRPSTTRPESTGCGRRRGDRRPARPGSRPRSRPWSVRCGGCIRGGVPGGSHSNSTGPARRRRRGPRCTGSWNATAWSWHRSNSIAANTSGGSGKRRCTCGSWIWSAGSISPTAESARC